MVYCGYYREYGDCLSHTAGICYVVIGGYGAMPRYSSTGVDGGEKRVMNTEATTLSYNEFVLGRMGLAD